jgi:uncharacterized protein (UPF0548 family)
MMSKRQIEIANAETSITRWTQYVNAAEAAGDQKRVGYGRLRLANAQKRLTQWRRA